MRYEHIAFILADSALPTGGFVASSGLEAAVTLGKLSDAGKTAIVKDKVIDFCKLSIASYAQQHVPYVHHVYNAHQISQILLSDDFLDAHIANEMTRRASLAQGISYLTLATKSFANEIKDETCYAWIKELKTLVRQRVAAGHLTTCFALLTRSLGMKRDDAAQLYVNLFARSLISAAVRMNLLDPYEAQTVLCHLEDDMYRAASNNRSRQLLDAVPTEPFLDLIQGAHEKLYTRMFHS